MADRSKFYQVEVFPDGGEEWRFDGLLHRENGPAITTKRGDIYWDIYWYLSGRMYPTLAAYKSALHDMYAPKTKSEPPTNLDSRMVEIDGKRYLMKLVEPGSVYTKVGVEVNTPPFEKIPATNKDGGIGCGPNDVCKVCKLCAACNQCKCPGYQQIETKASTGWK